MIKLFYFGAFFNLTTSHTFSITFSTIMTSEMHQGCVRFIVHMYRVWFYDLDAMMWWWQLQYYWDYCRLMLMGSDVQMLWVSLLEFNSNSLNHGKADRIAHKFVLLTVDQWICSHQRGKTFTPVFKRSSIFNMNVICVHTNPGILLVSCILAPVNVSEAGSMELVLTSLSSS